MARGTRGYVQMLWVFSTIAAILIVFFIPGYVLVKALFPREGELDPDHNTLYQIILGIVMSSTIFIFTSFLINALGTHIDPATGQEVGYFTAVNIWIALLSFTAIVFAIGWVRGAYPELGRFHPKLARLPPVGYQSILIYPEKERDAILERRRLTKEKFGLKKEIGHIDRWMLAASGDRRKSLAGQRKALLQKVGEIDDRLQEIERELMDQI